MTAHRLRTAAAKLREVAEGATPGPWSMGGGHQDSAPWPTTGVWSGDPDNCHTECDYPADATYIATMSPPVALAVAAWLDDMAIRNESGNDLHWPHPGDVLHALAVADAVLAEVAV